MELIKLILLLIDGCNGVLSIITKSFNLVRSIKKDSSESFQAPDESVENDSNHS